MTSKIHRDGWKADQSYKVLTHRFFFFSSMFIIFIITLKKKKKKEHNNGKVLDLHAHGK